MRWLIKAWGDFYESYPDMSVLIVALLGVILAVIPGKVAELERNPRFGKVWKYGLTLLLLAIGITGFIGGLKQKRAFQNQIGQLTSQSLVEATKDDVTSLNTHIDEGFAKIAEAIKAESPQSGAKAAPAPTHSKIPLPPPVVEHVRFTEKRVASTNPAAPYGLQVIIQTDTNIQPVGFKVECDGEISNGTFFVSGQTAMMSVANGIFDSKKAFAFSFRYPTFTPESPIVVTLESTTDIRVTKIERISPLY